jgi:antitoxin (DNA-binding transcriptional repressor) of toxin-antitoxin stability system
MLYRPLKQGTKKTVFAAIPFHGCEHLRAFSAQRPGLLNAVSIRTTLIRVPKRAVKLGPDAVRQSMALKAAERARLQAAMLALGGDDAAIEKPKPPFLLTRPSGQIEFEFRDGDLRVFYRVEDGQVLVDAIGRKHGNQSAHRRQEGDPVKIENIREVKTRFSRYIKELSETAPSSLPKNGRPCAALVPVTEDTDLEAVPLSQNKRFRNFIDNEIARGQPEGFIDLEDLQ